MASAIGGAISGFSTMKEGKAMQAAGQSGIDNFAWQDLTNPYKNLSASTAGAEMRADEGARAAATSVNALQQGGNRALVGGVGRVQAQNNALNREIAANLDEQNKNIDFAAAGQDVANQGVIEKRQQDELAGYGNMVNVGMDMRQNGMGQLVSAAGAIDSAAMTALTGGMGGENGIFGAFGNNITANTVGSTPSTGSYIKQGVLERDMRKLRNGKKV